MAREEDPPNIGNDITTIVVRRNGMRREMILGIKDIMITIMTKNMTKMVNNGHPKHGTSRSPLPRDPRRLEKGVLARVGKREKEKEKGLVEENPDRHRRAMEKDIVPDLNDHAGSVDRQTTGCGSVQILLEKTVSSTRRRWLT
jgi:hypothetical protein